MHYRDDFLFVGRVDSDKCANLIDTFQALSDKLGIPLLKFKMLQVEWVQGYFTKAGGMLRNVPPMAYKKGK